MATVFWMVATAATLVVIVLLVLGGVYAGAREDPATDEMILGGMIVGAITGLLSLTSGWLSHRWRRVPAPPVITYGAMVVALLPILLLVLVIGSRIRQS